MKLFSALTGTSDTRTGQQCRAKANRKAARAGQAWEDGGRRRDRQLANPTPPAPRAWWRSP